MRGKCRIPIAETTTGLEPWILYGLEFILLYHLEKTFRHCQKNTAYVTLFLKGPNLCDLIQNFASILWKMLSIDYSKRSACNMNHTFRQTIESHYVLRINVMVFVVFHYFVRN